MIPGNHGLDCFYEGLHCPCVLRFRTPTVAVNPHDIRKWLAVGRLELHFPLAKLLAMLGGRRTSLARVTGSLRFYDALTTIVTLTPLGHRFETHHLRMTAAGRALVRQSLRQLSALKLLCRKQQSVG